MASRGSSFCKILIILFLLTGYLGRLTVHVYAQNQDASFQESRFSFVLIHIPLSEALDELVRETGIDIFYESELIRDKTAYCNIENSNAEQALSCILRSAGLDFYQQSSGIYVISPIVNEKPKFSSLTGIVLDANTDEPLPYASIVLEEASTGTATNIEGRFAFSRLKPGPYRVLASHVAYEGHIDSIYVDPSAHQQVKIKLKPRTVMSTPIVVNGLQQRFSPDALNAFSIPSSRLQNAPASSTPSTLQSLDAVVGVHVGDALADVHVQGGDAGEHQYLLDDAPVFVPIRNGGFFGTFSPFAINQVTVHKAGFAARHGSYLSGSIHLTHDIQATDGSKATIQIDPLSVNGRVNGSIDRGEKLTAQWMLAGRLGLWDVFQPHQIEQSFREWSQPNTFLSNTLAGNNDPTLPTSPSFADSLLNFSFSDIHAATRIRFGNARSIYASFYEGMNEFGIGSIYIDPSLFEENEVERAGEAYRWSNKTSQIRYEWVQGDRTFFKIGLWSSKYILSHPFANSPFGSLTNPSTSIIEDAYEDFNEVKELGVQAGFDWAPGARHVISGNLQTIHTEAEFKLSIDPFSDSLQIQNKALNPLRLKIQSFIEDAFAISKQARLTLGSRLTYIPIQKRLYAEPRATIRYDLPDGRWAFQVATGLYRQFYNQFDVTSYNSSAILPSFRFWIPINKDTRASTAYHSAASVLFAPGEKWKLNIEGYYKYLPNLTVLDYTARLGSGIDAMAAASFFQRARGYAYGAGFSLAYETKILNFKTSYEYAKSKRKTANRFDGRYISVPWETPHQLFAVVDYTLANQFTLTLRWQGLFGRSWGYRRAYYDYLEPIPMLDELSALSLSQPQRHKLPAFTQWDVGIAYGKTLGKLSIQGRLNFVNLLNESNVIDWIMVTDQFGQLQKQSRVTTPFFPSASLRITY